MLLILAALLAVSPAPPASTAPPDMRELLLALMHSQNLRLGTFVHHEGCVASETLGEYVATLIANGLEGDTHSLSASCSEYDPSHSKLHPPRDANAVWECHFRAYTADRNTASPWHYELHVFIEKPTRKLDTKTLACPGT